MPGPTRRTDPRQPVQPAPRPTSPAPQAAKAGTNPAPAPASPPPSDAAQVGVERHPDDPLQVDLEALVFAESASADGTTATVDGPAGTVAIAHEGDGVAVQAEVAGQTGSLGAQLQVSGGVQVRGGIRTDGTGRAEGNAGVTVQQGRVEARIDHDTEQGTTGAVAYRDGGATAQVEVSHRDGQTDAQLSVGYQHGEKGRVSATYSTTGHAAVEGQATINRHVSVTGQASVDREGHVQAQGGLQARTAGEVTLPNDDAAPNAPDQKPQTAPRANLTVSGQSNGAVQASATVRPSGRVSVTGSASRPAAPAAGAPPTRPTAQGEVHVDGRRTDLTASTGPTGSTVRASHDLGHQASVSGSVARGQGRTTVSGSVARPLGSESSVNLTASRTEANGEAVHTGSATLRVNAGLSVGASVQGDGRWTAQGTLQGRGVTLTTQLEGTRAVEIQLQRGDLQGSVRYDRERRQGEISLRARF